MDFRVGHQLSLVDLLCVPLLGYSHFSLGSLLPVVPHLDLPLSQT